MPVKYQGGTPKKIYHGSDLVEAIFYGGTQIWPTHPNLPAVTGAYALSGKVAVLRRARKLIAAAGTFVRSGQPANFVRTRVMSALAAVFALSGQAVVLIAGRPFLGEVGSFALSGQAALRRSRTFAAAAGAYAISGHDAALNYSGGGYAFNMTAGSHDAGGGFVFTGYLGSSAGSVDDEWPLDPADNDYALLTLASLPGLGASILFEDPGGELPVLLAGLSVWINGVEKPFDTNWTFDAENLQTSGGWTSGTGPVFVNGNSYFVEIK